MMSNRTTKSFGQVQMIAKTLLIICGIFIVDIVLRDFIILLPSVFPTSAKASLIGVLFYSIATILFLAAIIVFMIFNNNWLVKKILPAEETVPAEYEKLWFSSSLRIGLVFCGLIFFAVSADALLYAIKTVVDLPFLGRQLFSDIIYGNHLFNVKDSHFYVNIYRFLKMVLAIYLIAGAPGFIGWQMRRTYTIQNQKE